MQGKKWIGQQPKLDSSCKSKEIRKGKDCAYYANVHQMVVCLTDATIIWGNAFLQPIRMILQLDVKDDDAARLTPNVPFRQSHGKIACRSPHVAVPGMMQHIIAPFVSSSFRPFAAVQMALEIKIPISMCSIFRCYIVDSQS